MEHLSRELLDSYLGDERARRIARRYLPSREAIAEILQGVLDLMYPGYFGRRDLNRENLGDYVSESLAALAPRIEREMEHCLCYGREQDDWRDEARPEGSVSADARRPGFGECAPRARELTEVFLGRLPEIRALLVRDVQAAYDGDPAASNLDEVILAYPGVLAVSVYRIAHALYDLGVPMMARIMTEWAHSKTGCDIHPGARIGAAFFIDHATGVVIGETSDIGGRQAVPGRDARRLVAAQGCQRADHPRQQAPSDGGERLDTLCERDRTRGQDRGGRRERHRRLGIPDPQHPAALAGVAEGAGSQGRLARRHGRVRRDLFRHLG